MTIKAIETRYAGCRFRSRTEARWAVFMDHLDIPWEYEPQGYVLEDGTAYLPDFLVYPNTDAAFWFEVKGTFPLDEELDKARGLAVGTGISCFVYWGKPEVPGPDLSHLTMDQYTGWDQGGYVWTNNDGWREYPTLPAVWQRDLAPTAFRFDPSGRPEKARSGFWWWMDCPHCDRVVIKAGGQVGGCPGADPEDEPTYPRFSHDTPRLVAAYRAARSARFEHGESG